MTTLSLQLALPPRKRRVSGNYPPLPIGAVFDLDATIATSYPGSGQYFNNLVPSPANGEPAADYNFFLGSDASVATDDPTFTGGAGAKSSYFLLDGGDRFSAPDDVYFRRLFRKDTAQIITMITVFMLPNDTGFQYLWGNYPGGSVSGMRTDILNGSSLRISASNGVTSSAAALHSVTYDTPYLHVLTFDNGTGQYKSALNSRSFTVFGTISSASDNTSDNTTRHFLGSAGGGNPMKNGTRIYAHAGLFGAMPTDAQLSALVDIYNARHGRTYA